MGKILELLVEQVRPSQNYLDRKRFERYKQMFENGQGDGLAPVPVVEDYSTQGVYYVLDGHHRGSAQLQAQGKITVWNASNPNDFIPYGLFPNVTRDKIDSAN